MRPMSTRLEIRFKVRTLEEFIERHRLDVSEGGIFIRSRRPLPKGTQCEMELRLANDAPLFCGQATVVWVRCYNPEYPLIAPGFGLRFEELTDETRPNHRRVIAELERRGELVYDEDDERDPEAPIEEPPVVLPDDACPVCGKIMVERDDPLQYPIGGENYTVGGISHLVCTSCGEVMLSVDSVRRLREAAEAIRAQQTCLPL